MLDALFTSIGKGKGKVVIPFCAVSVISGNFKSEVETPLDFGNIEISALEVATSQVASLAKLAVIPVMNVLAPVLTVGVVIDNVPVVLLPPATTKLEVEGLRE